MVIPQPSFPNRRSLEGAQDPSILCAAPGEKNLKMFVKQMCVTRMMFFQLGSLVYEYFSKLHLADLAFEALLIPTIDSCRRCLRHLQNKECAKITMCESEDVCLIWMGYIIHFEVQTTSLM